MTARPSSIATRSGVPPDVSPFDRLGRFVVRRAWWVVAAWVALLLVAIPFAPRRPGQLSAGGFILDDLESARAKALLETELGVAAVGPRRRLLAARRSRPARRRSRPPRPRRDRATSRRAPHVARVVSHLLAPRQVSADGHTAYDIVFLDLPPDDSPDALPILRERLHDGARARRRARRRAGVLRRRPDRVRVRPAPQRAHLAAAGRARAALRVRSAGRGRRAAGRRWRGRGRRAGGDLRRRDR